MGYELVPPKIPSQQPFLPLFELVKILFKNILMFEDVINTIHTAAKAGTLQMERRRQQELQRTHQSKTWGRDSDMESTGY
jgi:hypothetical protein